MPELRVHTVVAPYLDANCYVVADGSSCIIVDAGMGIVPGVRNLLDRESLTPHAVFATHGHVDHVWDATELCAEFGVPLVIHQADEYRLADPWETLDSTSCAETTAFELLAQSMGIDTAGHGVPASVITFDAAGLVPVELEFGGVVARGVHAPGHTEGSTLFVFDAGGPGSGEGSGSTMVALGDAGLVALTGDVLFAGTIGRTDFPGGELATMRHTLATVFGIDGPLGADALILPGHGPQTTLARERRVNPFLTQR